MHQPKWKLVADMRLEGTLFLRHREDLLKLLTTGDLFLDCPDTKNEEVHRFRSKDLAWWCKDRSMRCVDSESTWT